MDLDSEQMADSHRVGIDGLTSVGEHKPRYTPIKLHGILRSGSCKGAAATWVNTNAKLMKK
jgi:hypothetical protein